MVVYQVFWRCFTWNVDPVAPPGARGIHLAAPASVGRCCARPWQCGRWPQAKSGRCRRTGKRAIRGAALAGRRRVVGAFGALVAMVAHYEKCSEWRQTRSPALALFGRPPLHFSPRAPMATNAPGVAGVRFRVGTVARNVAAMLRLPSLARDRAGAPPPPGNTAPTTRRSPASAAPRIARLPVRRQRPNPARGQRPRCDGRAQQRPTGARATWWIELAPGCPSELSFHVKQPRNT